MKAIPAARMPPMTEILDQSDLTDRAARLVEAAKRAGADAADTVCVRGMSLSVDMRLGKVEETRRAEGDDFTLRVFVGRRSATVSANVLADPAELATRAVAMARVAPEDRFAGLADPDRLARDFADVDILDAGIPSAAELTDMALAVEDAARAVRAAPRPAGRSAGWCSPPRPASPGRISPRASACPPRRSPARAPPWSATTRAR